MSLRTTGATNFYYYGQPLTAVKASPYPHGQKITTQLSSNVIKIRILATLLLTARLSYKYWPNWWSWPVAILAVGYVLYVAYKHLLTIDPLVEFFYKIAGGKDKYNNLPEFKLDQENDTMAISANSASTVKTSNVTAEKANEAVSTSKRTIYRFKHISWKALEHPLYRFTTQDGRKGMLVKGLSYLAQPDLMNLLTGAPPAQTKAIMVFVEKLSLYDLQPVLPDWLGTIALVLSFTLENSLSRLISSSSGGSSSGMSFDNETKMYSSISTDMANEFIIQSDVINQLNPQIVEVKDDQQNTTPQAKPQVMDADSEI